MKKLPALFGILLTLCVFSGGPLHAQKEDVKSLAAAEAYCDSIIKHVYYAGHGVYYAEDKMWKTALQALKLVPAGDIADSAKLYYYASLGYGHLHELTLDSLLQMYYTSLRLAQQSRIAPLIAKVC